MRAAALALAVALAGCGTVIGHGRAPVTLTSYPSGAHVYVDGVDRGQTPLEVVVPTKGTHTIEFELDGKRGSCQVSAGVSGMWVAFDVAMGLIPLVVDAVTGGWRALDFDACQARFSAQ